MNIQIIETGAYETLSIIDPQSGTDWIQDLLGNYDALPRYNGDIDAYEMTQAEYNWWLDLTATYEKQDRRMHELRQRAESVEEFLAAWARYNSSNDLEDMPAQMEQFCDAWEAGDFNA